MFCACAHDQTVSPDQDQQTLRILVSNFQVSFTMTVNTATELYFSRLCSLTQFCMTAYRNSTVPRCLDDYGMSSGSADQ